jgi:hypothetical protein
MNNQNDGMLQFDFHCHRVQKVTRTYQTSPPVGTGIVSTGD